ncbi:MAG: hypothetical protein P8N43_01860 [Alphaproteobacteria bacterium]|nr:hypothetical protein [Alphaproteobacteria bacterium]
MDRMLRLFTIIALILLGVSRPAAALPDKIAGTVIQLADAVGVLSSRSCRDGERAEIATRVLSHLLHYAGQTKHLDYASGRKYRRKWVIPMIRAARGVSHSSRDCGTAKETVDAITKTWDVPLEFRSARSSGPRSAGLPADGTLPATPIIGATRSDTLSDKPSK